MLRREAGAVQILGKLLVPAQESQHVHAGEGHETNKKGFPEGQQCGKCTSNYITLR